MNKDFSVYNFLEHLAEICSTTGYEAQAQKYIYDQVKHRADRVITDTIGNLCLVINDSNKPGVLLCAHIDEIGYFVKHIDDNGFIYLTGGYGAYANPILSEHVKIFGKNGVTYGIVGVKLDKGKKDDKKELGFEDIWVDIGAADKEEAEKYVALGDVVTVDKGPLRLLNNRISARSLDDKMGVLALVMTMLKLDADKLDVPVYCLFSAQEESGFRGIRSFMTNKIRIKAGLSLDVGSTSDIPKSNKVLQGNLALGDGPILSRGPNNNPKLHCLIEETAKQHNIPYQLRAIPRPSPVDANIIQVSGDIAAGQIDVPIRYMHHQSEVCALDDLHKTVDLLTNLLYSISDDIRFQLEV